MTKKRKFYSGNYPNLPGYDENLPIGWIQWDEAEVEDELDEDLELENSNDEPENNNE